MSEVVIRTHALTPLPVCSPTASFQGWATKFDEWLPRDTPRIAPFGANLRQPVAYRPKAVTYWSRHDRTQTWGTANVDKALVRPGVAHCRGFLRLCSTSPVFCFDARRSTKRLWAA